MSTPLISYIIPYYNGQETIFRQLESIYATHLTPDELEVIIVDDCSPIPAEVIINPQISLYPGLKIIRHTKNLRQGGAKNTGIRMATGTYIAFADQDDTIVPDHIAKIIHLSLRCQSDIFVCLANRLRLNGKTEVYSYPTENATTTSGPQFCEQFYKLAYSASPWSNIYRRQYLLNQHRPMAENTLLEDVDWVQHHLFYADSITIFNRPIYNWHANTESITHMDSPRLVSAYVAHGYRKIKNSRLFHTTSPQFAETVREDGQYNISTVLKIAWRVPHPWKIFDDNGCGELTSEIWEELSKMQWDKKTSFLIHHRTLAAIITTMAFPLRWANYIRRKVIYHNPSSQN